MRNPYRFRKRKTKSGHIFYVCFRANPEKWISTGQTNIVAATQWAEHYNPENGPVSITFKEFTKDFFLEGQCAWLKRMNQKGHTYGYPHLKRYRQILEGHWIPVFGNLLIGSIRRKQIDEYLMSLNVAAETKNKYLSALRTVLSEAEYQELIDRNPAREVRLFKGKTKERKIFTPEELAKLFPEDIKDLKAIFIDLEWALYFYLQASCGLRPSEVAALYWSDWKKEYHGFIVTSSIEMFTGRRKTTKTNIVKPAILTEKAEFLLTLIGPGRSDDNLIFSVNNAPIKLETSNKHFKASCEKAGVERGDRTQYSLRHTFNTLALTKLPVNQVQKLMGHQTEAMTAHYNHPTEADILGQVQSARDILKVLF